MALYEYVCPTCKGRFEKLRSMEHGATADCPRCGEQASRVLSVIAAPARAGAGAASGPVASDRTGGGGCACGGACSCAA